MNTSSGGEYDAVPNTPGVCRTKLSRENVQIILDGFRSNTNPNLADFTVDARKALSSYAWSLKNPYAQDTNSTLPFNIVLTVVKIAFIPGVENMTLGEYDARNGSIR